MNNKDYFQTQRFKLQFRLNRIHIDLSNIFDKHFILKF